ncbi:MAG: S9 family peptidase [Bacteroidota bacterium]|nr:MAG: S9 family peptidase [Bacteroidota bacterium]
MKKLYGSILFTVLLISSCNMTPTKPEETIIDKPTVELKGNRLTPELLWAFGRVGEVALSPDGQSILYSVKYYDVAENKGNSEIYLMNIDGSGKKQITHSAKSESNICWRPDGKKIAFLYSDDIGTQLWEMDPDGTNRKKISQVEGGITGFKFSPDQTKIVYSKEVTRTDKVIDRHPDLPKANAYLGNDLMIRHWDSWKDSHSHLFVADYTGDSLLNLKDIMEGELFDSPKKPFGGMEQVAWSPDSKSLVYTSQKLSGAEYARSTNTDLYHYQLETGQTNNLTQGMMGYDINPVFSPNGKYLAFESMEHDGYESDLNRLFILDLQTGSMSNCSDNFDQMVHGLVWDEKSENLYFTSDWHARYQVYEYNLLSKTYRALTQGDHNYQAVWYSSGKLIATKMSISMPTEVFSVDISNGTETQLSDVNSELLAKLNMGKVEERWVKTTDNKQMLVWVIYPPDFDSTKKYPALLYCQGGPQSSVSQFFSYRWNFQLMAANDYIVVAPNRRGLPSFGHEWNKQISGDYGGQNMKDYLSAIDALALEPYVDENRLGAVGASYGGFSVYWLAGNHQNRFKAFIAHDGIFNLEAQYLETEETFFVEWDLGGPYWDQSNRIAQRSYANSPHLFVDRWNTPIMVIHGEKDYRVLYSQGLQAYTAARLRGIPARYLHFPEENHWVLAPQNSILWHREFYIWLDQWLK